VVVLSEKTKGKELRPTLAEIRRIASEECGIGPDEIRLGGPPVDNVAIDVEGERTLFRLAGLSAIVGLGISFLCLRSLRLTAIVFWVALLAAGVGLALVYFTGATCDAILLSMPSLVYVLAMSGSIHIINYYHDAIRERGLEGAADRAIQHGWYPCTMAALTTALGLGSLMMSHVIPISKFGLYSALGVMATLGLLFLYLPALLHYFPSRAHADKHAGRGLHAGRAMAEPQETVFHRGWRVGGGFIVRHNVAVSIGCLALMAVAAGGLGRIKTSVKLMKLFSPEAEIISHYQWLEDNLGPLVPMEVVLTVDNEQCHLTFLDRMRLVDEIRGAIKRKLSDVGGVLSATTFAPDIRPRGGSFLRRSAYDSGLSRALEDYRDDFHEHLAVDVDRLETEDPTLQELRIPAEIAASLRAENLETLRQIEAFGDLADVAGIGPAEAAEVAQAIAAWKAVSNPTLEELGISGPIAEALSSKKLRTLRAIEQRGYLGAVQGVGAEGDALVAHAIKAWKTAHGTELWRISARIWALTDVDYAHFINDVRDVVDPVIEKYRQDNAARGIEVRGLGARYTGLVPLVYKTQHELMRGLQTSLASAFGLIAIVMIIVLKSPSAGLLAMVPNVFPVILIFGGMGWLGIVVDIGTMMTASVALGVAVDDTMHFLAWFRTGLDQGQDRKEAVMTAYQRCGTAMTQTTLIGGLGLAVFAFSTFTPTQRFGTLMLVLLATALVGDLVFLPAILTSPLGYFFGKRRKLKHQARSKRSPGDDVDENGADAVLVPIEEKPGTLHTRNDPSHRSNRAS
jgi:predicted RND superfamily exporter protein